MIKKSIFFLVLASTVVSAETRTWTDGNGNLTRAVLRGFDGGDVLLQNADGKTVRVAMKNLSVNDQSYVVLAISKLLDQSSASLGTLPTKPLAVFSKKSWPSTLNAPDNLTDARYVEENSEAGLHVYRSRRFEYVIHADGPLAPIVMKDVARVFEGTYELLCNSPFGVQAQPVDGYFRAELYQTMGMYHEAGGPVGSGGVYVRSEKRIKVPLESLGLKRNNSGYVKDDNYELKTLVHEITHMMMHDILPLLPRWLVEGSAEYVECIPYKSGSFRHSGLEASLKRYNKERFSGQFRLLSRPPDFISIMSPPKTSPEIPGIVVSIPPVSVPPSISNNWRIGFYHSSMLLTYYFMHLDGDGKGTRLLKFLDAVRSEQPKYAAFVKQFDAYRAAMEDFLKKPEVKELPDGRFQYPDYLKAPAAPKPEHPDYMTGNLGHIHHGILLDGRTEAQLQEEVTAALQNLGIRTEP